MSLFRLIFWINIVIWIISQSVELFWKHFVAAVADLFTRSSPGGMRSMMQRAPNLPNAPRWRRMEMSRTGSRPLRGAVVDGYGPIKINVHASRDRPGSVCNARCPPPPAEINKITGKFIEIEIISFKNKINVTCTTSTLRGSSDRLTTFRSRGRVAGHHAVPTLILAGFLRLNPNPGTRKLPKSILRVERRRHGATWHAVRAKKSFPNQPTFSCFAATKNVNRHSDLVEINKSNITKNVVVKNVVVACARLRGVRIGSVLFFRASMGWSRRSPFRQSW